MNAADADIDVELQNRLNVIATEERDDPSRRALTGADLGLFVGVSVAIALVGLLVLAL